MNSKRKAIVLLSGGLDSATVLYLAKRQGYDCFCLIFDYGQRHRREIESATRLAKSAGCRWQVVNISLPWKGSALLDREIKVATSLPDRLSSDIPNTYVPARNSIFLSFAMSCAEAIGAEAIFIGAHAQDYSGYPDCRPEFYRAFDQVISRGTKAGTQNRQIKIETPIIDKTKAEIIKLGASLGVPFALTWSCYEGAQEPCGKCDSCYYRAKGFQETGLIDPLGLGRRGVEQMLACAESMKGRFLNGRQKQIKARIAEVFCSVQGEGIYLGEEQVFVRFFGCNLSCRFCDTKLNRFAEYEPQELFEEIKLYENKFHSVSFTGGEPLLQKDFLKEVLKLTKKEGHKNYLETNGTLSGELEDVIDYLDIVSMDLKLPSSAGMGNLWGLHRRFFKVASRKDVFVKAIICAATKEEDLKEAVSLIKEVNRSAILVLQPNSFEDYNLARERTESFRDMCIKENVLTCVIPQIHKVVGVQ